MSKALVVDGPLRGQLMDIPADMSIRYPEPGAELGRFVDYRLVRYAFGQGIVINLMTEDPLRPPDPGDLLDLLLSSDARQCVTVAGGHLSGPSPASEDV